MDGRGATRRAFAGPIVVAVSLAFAATGAGLLTGAGAGPRPSTGAPPTVTDKPQDTTVVPATTTTSVPSPDEGVTSSTAVTPVDSLPPFLDTSDKAAVEAAWASARSRPRHRMNWTGSVSSCRAGTTAEAFKLDVLTRVNWFRAMAGVPAQVELDAESSHLAQEAALVMAAAGDLSHDPDSSWPCYSTDALIGAGHSNLFLGVFGVDSIDGYIEDPGEDNLPVGHRRWILDPTLTRIGTGDTRNSNALFVIQDEFDVDAPTREQDGFVMWPPRGHVPRSQIYPRWSVSHRSADFSSATVVVTHAGRTRVYREPYSDNDGYGRMNTLVFEWRRPARGSGPVQIRVRDIELDGVFVELDYVVMPFG